MLTLLTDPAFCDSSELRVEGDSYRHLFSARRLEVGEELRIVDGRGRARWGKVARVDRPSAPVTLAGPAPEREPAFRLDLIVPTCRPERASWLVEKATEVGVHAVRFVNMARAPRELGAGTMDRLCRVAEAAVEQSHRCRLPEVTGPHSWSEVGRLAEGAGARWFLDPEAAPGWGGDVRGEGERGALLVGPEGGLDPGERRELLAAGWQPAGLGDRILRLETAALVGASFLLLIPPGKRDSDFRN